MTSTTSAPPDSSSRGFILVIVAIVILGLGAVAFLAANRDGGSNEEQTATVELEGDVLSTFPLDNGVSDATNDPTVGTVAPTVVGTDFEGNEVKIENDGRAKVLYFLAHWCPHCQEEVPVVQDLLDNDRLPEDVDIYAISTSVSPERGNFPPEVWLRRESFTSPVIRDDEIGTTFASFGGTGFPYVVYLDAEHKVVTRSSGGLPAETIAGLWELTASAPVG